MANLADVRDRLQPALLDRLTDEAPLSRVEAEDCLLYTSRCV